MHKQPPRPLWSAGQLVQDSGDRWGTPFLRFTVMASSVADMHLDPHHVCGRGFRWTLLRLFLNSVVAMTLQLACDLRPTDSDKVQDDVGDSKTETGVMWLSSSISWELSLFPIDLSAITENSQQFQESSMVSPLLISSSWWTWWYYPFHLVNIIKMQQILVLKWEKQKTKFEPCRKESSRGMGLGGYDHMWCKSYHCF